MFKSVNVPREILILPHAKLAEKLALAVYAAIPEITPPRVRRVLAISGAGLRMLKRRLAQKGLLTRHNDRHIVRIPGSVYEDHPDGGHIVPFGDSIKKQQKVAPPQPSPPSAVALADFVIPAEIINLKGVSASGKFVLSVYADNPTATNAQVLEILATSLAGLKKIKRRLIDAGLLTATATGYRVHVPGLVFLGDSAGGQFVSETDAIKNGQIVAPLVVRKVRSVQAIYDEWLALMMKWKELGGAAPWVLQETTANYIKQIMDEAPETPGRAVALSYLKTKENFYFALQYADANLPSSYFKQINTALLTATSDQLADFRDQGEGLKLARATPQKMLNFFGSAVDLACPATSPSPA
jgi:hypothetical protein